MVSIANNLQLLFCHTLFVIIDELTIYPGEAVWHRIVPMNLKAGLKLF